MNVACHRSAGWDFVLRTPGLHEAMKSWIVHNLHASHALRHPSYTLNSVQKRLVIFLTRYSSIALPSFHIGVLFHWEWDILFTIPLKYSCNCPILKFCVPKSLTDLGNSKVFLSLQRFTDNLSSPAIFGMFMQVARRSPVCFIKISPHDSRVGAFPFAMWCRTFELMATTPINNFDCRTCLKKPIYRRCPVFRHPF